MCYIKSDYSQSYSGTPANLLPNLELIIKSLI